VGKYQGQDAHFAHYYDDQRRLVSIHVRTPDKDFPWIGKANPGLYGNQAQGVKWPVVSVPGGAAGAKRAIEKDLDWLEKFDEVLFAFDMDEPGRDAVDECAALLTPGKAKVVVLPEGMKDANDMLVAGRTAELIDALWGAKVYRPDGIIDGAHITREELQEPVLGYALRYPKLNEKIGDIREAELTLLTAGSGIGKSTLAREIAYGLHQDHGLTIGNIYLEESVKKTAQGYVAIDNNVPLGRLRKDPKLITDEQWDASLIKVVHKRMFFYDHFGSLESDNLIAKIRYMRVALGCHFIILDHISIVVSGSEGSGEGERRDIDKLMTKLRSLIEQTGVGIIAIVHLKQPEGKPHEEGGRVTLSQLRGSGALKQLSDNVIALERNQQGGDPNKSLARVLKCREFGETGEADELEYDPDTGRLLPTTGFKEQATDDRPDF
jgi:twinkle protein